jgi:O-antigen/teichoic acid export membrane protein
LKLGMSSFARFGAWSLLAQAIQVGGALLLSVFIVRSLGEEGFGELSVLRQVAAALVTVSGLALDRTLLRYLPELHLRASGSRARRFFLTSLFVRVLAWAIIGGVFVALSPQLSAVFHLDDPKLVLLTVACALAFSIYVHFRAGAIASFSTRAVAGASVLSLLATLALTLYVLNRGASVEGVLLASALGPLLALPLLAIPSLRGRIVGAAADAEPEAGEPESIPVGTQAGAFRRRVFRYTSIFAAIAVLNHIVHSQTEVLLLGHFRSVQEAGFFQLGFSFAQRVIDFLPLALWEVSMAGFSRIAVEDPKQLVGAVHTYLKLLYLGVLPVGTLGIVFSGSIIRFLYPEAMAPAIGVSQAYFFIAQVAAVGAPLGMIVYAREKMGAALRAYLIFSVLNVVLDFALIPRFGIHGAVAALAAGKFAAVYFMGRIALREMPEIRIPLRFIFRTAAACSPLAIWFVIEPTAPSFFVLCGAGLGAMLLLLLSFRLFRVLDSEDCELLRSTGLPGSAILPRLLGGG